MLCQLNISHRYKSINFDSRKKKISFLIFHYTETDNLAKAIKLLTNKKRRVSCHYLIDTNGRIYNLVDEKKRAWHAGESIFKGRENCNEFSIGIELEGTDHEAFTDSQYKTLICLTNRLLERYPKIDLDRIYGHSDVAPGRKTDPGPYFEWERYLDGLDQSLNS